MGPMKSLLYLIGGIGVATAFMLARKQQSDARTLAAQPVEELAHRLQDAWVDHHTVA